MIWGEAGVGKTTFCAKFCQDWALIVKEKEGKEQELSEEQKSELEKLTERKSKLNNIGLLFYIVLRDIGQGAKSVKDIILSQLGIYKEGTFMSQPGLENQLLGILENVSEHSRLVLMMDGFDEISDKDKEIEQVITGETYQNIQSITTCRPHAIGDNVLNVDIEIRLKGFSEAQTKSFVNMYARIEFSEQDQIVLFVKEFMNQVQSSANMKCLTGVDIDTEIAEAVSRLPDDIQLDLSGNKLTKMDHRLLPGVLLQMPNGKEIDMTGWEITIDVDVVRALSNMHQLKSLKASRNELTPGAARSITTDGTI